MKNQEIIYRELLYLALEKNEFFSTQSELSKKLHISLSIINSSIKKLGMIGAVKISKRNFHILDIKKILYLWASIRNINKDIIFKIRLEMPVREIERIMPDVIFTAYTGYKLKYDDVPADYSEVYAYADEKVFEKIKERISIMKNSSNNPNLFILKKDKMMNLYDTIPVSQIFVDLWNLKEWYAKDFIDALNNKLKLF